MAPFCGSWCICQGFISYVCWCFVLLSGITYFLVTLARIFLGLTQSRPRQLLHIAAPVSWNAFSLLSFSAWREWFIQVIPLYNLLSLRFQSFSCSGDVPLVGQVDVQGLFRIAFNKWSPFYSSYNKVRYGDCYVQIICSLNSKFSCVRICSEKQRSQGAWKIFYKKPWIQ